MSFRQPENATGVVKRNFVDAVTDSALPSIFRGVAGQYRRRLKFLKDDIRLYKGLIEDKDWNRLINHPVLADVEDISDVLEAIS